MLPGAQDHQGAGQAMVLGIIAMVCLATGLGCCVTIPGLVCAPIAWVKGARAKREIDAHPGVYGNRGQAVAGIVMGVIGSVGGVLVILAIVAFALLDRQRLVAGSERASLRARSRRAPAR